jgi:hypothetical protein
MTVDGPPRVSTAQQRLRQLRSKMDTANVKADEAIGAYSARKALLLRRNPTESGYKIAKRDDGELTELGNAATFQTATATRHAATLAVELLALLVRHLTDGGGQ